MLISQFDQPLLPKAQTLARFPEAGTAGINLGFTEEPLPEFQEGKDSEYYQVWFKDGSELARSPSLALNEALPRRSRPNNQIEFLALFLPAGRAGALRLSSELEDNETVLIILRLPKSG